MSLTKKKKILTLSGSLSERSTNSILLRALAQLAPPNLESVAYQGVSGLPHFNPDLDIEEQLPPAVLDFRNQLAEADGLIFSTPEYVHNLPGSLKNALEWGVSASSFSQKPVALCFVSAGAGEQVQAILHDTLTVLEAKIITCVSFFKNEVVKGIAPSGTITNPALCKTLQDNLKPFFEWVTTN